MRTFLKKSITIGLLLITISHFVKGQSIGVEAWLTDPGAPMQSGFYQGLNVAVGQLPDMSNGWFHLINARHSNPNNNYQLQIGASYNVNDRLFFRKTVNGDANSANPDWIEVATRYNNTFTGTQVFPGNGIWNTNGSVGIGTITPDANYKLSVNGKIRAKEIKVESNWADFVFDPTYKLRSLLEVETFIRQNKHLPDVPSAKEVAKEGIGVGEMEATLLQKIEELTLYIIAQEKRIKSLEEKSKK